jgi:hypothetical protein
VQKISRKFNRARDSGEVQVLGTGTHRLTGFFLSPFLSDMVPLAPLPDRPLPESPFAPLPDMVSEFGGGCTGRRYVEGSDGIAFHFPSLSFWKIK